MANVKNQSNEYAKSLGEWFDQIPKSVLAAIAVSALTCGGDLLDDAIPLVMQEWDILEINGIVPQKPPKQWRGYRLETYED